MAARQLFWKWHLWKSTGFRPWPQTTCIWNLKLKFHSKLQLHPGNHATYRVQILKNPLSLHWRHNGHDSISNHQPHDCLLNRLFRRRSKKTSKLPVTGLCAGNSPGTVEFPAQMASYEENVSIWWCHHDGRQAAILKVTLLNINRLFPMHTNDVPVKFRLYSQSQTKVTVPKPPNPISLPGGHFESDIAENQ